ncbi:hypothetical protein RHSIM_Rhsim09G0066500 [Rhododendron simsii]|uniref:Uncharacterized protein n=1 Tax=Rhododendron simsii TaxID=118357 RepID=A0A834GKX1_RHOSS|nr:hypothetical protein RHSIM_Rhsim09G0066500 [Rhododendron simsii]
MSYPHATYQYATVDVVDGSSIRIMFDIVDKITDYTTVLFTKTMPYVAKQMKVLCTNVRENVEDADDELIVPEEVHDDITDLGAFEMHIRDIDEASQR